MKICKNCGAEIQDGAAFCTHCGTKVEEQRVEEQRVEPEKTEQAAQPVEPEQTSGQSQAESQNAGAQNVNYGQNPNYGQSQNYGHRVGISRIIHRMTRMTTHRNLQQKTFLIIR